MRTYTIVVEPEQGGGYDVTVPALPGCFYARRHPRGMPSARH